MLIFDKYRDRFKEIYPNLNDDEIEKIFNLRVDFFSMIVDKYDCFLENHKNTN